MISSARNSSDGGIVLTGSHVISLRDHRKEWPFP